MAALRCNTCVYLKQGFCSKIGEALPHRLAKLFYGGAERIYAGTVTYPSQCGIEKQQMNEEDLDMVVFVMKGIARELVTQ
jgi:hypothetical protein